MVVALNSTRDILTMSFKDFTYTQDITSILFTFQSEDVDFNADIHGNWTLENAKSRLHQFLQTNKIQTDYSYKMVGPDHNRYVLVDILHPTWYVMQYQLLLN